MAFVRKKTINGQTYHYLVESRRVDGKPRQRVIAYLGPYPDLEEAWTWLFDAPTKHRLRHYVSPELLEKDARNKVESKRRREEEKKERADSAAKTQAWIDDVLNDVVPKARNLRHYTTLGLQPEASPAEVKARYRELAKQFHPDHNKDGEARMREVIAAYRALTTSE
jgi:hypothetical protein